MEHEVFVPVAAETLRKLLRDPARVARCVPGLQQDADASAGPLSGRLKVRVGGHTITYRGALHLTEQGEAFAIEGEGAEVRGTGSVKVTLMIRPEPAEGGTSLSFTGSSHAEGRLAEVAPDTATSAAHRLLDRVVAEAAVMATAADRGAPEAAGAGPLAPATRPGESTGSGESNRSADGDAAADGTGGAAVGPGSAEGAVRSGGPVPGASGLDDADAAASAPGPGEGDVAAADGTGGAAVGPGSAEGAVRSGGPVPGASGLDDADAAASAPGRGEGDDVAAADDAADTPSDPGSAGSAGGDDSADAISSAFENPVPPPSLGPDADEQFDDLDRLDEMDELAGADAPDELPAEAAHARRTMIGRSAEEVDHAPPRGRYAPTSAPDTTTAGATLRWIAPAAALALASAVVLGRVLRRRQ